MRYRRVLIPSAKYFFTLVTNSRQPVFKDEHSVALLRSAFRYVMKKWPFSIDAIVILPDHIHCIWGLPEGDVDYSTRWRLLKSWLTRKYRVRDNIRFPLWQNRYWEHLIRDEEDYANHVDYIHYNPVKHGFAEKPADWPYSSFKKYVDSGCYDDRWGCGGMAFPEGIGKE